MALAGPGGAEPRRRSPRRSPPSTRSTRRLPPASAGDGRARTSPSTASSRRALAPLRGKRFVSAHRAWVYFADRYGLVEAASIEPVPGREPSPRELKALVEEGRRGGLGRLFTEPQFPPAAARVVAREARPRADARRPDRRRPGAGDVSCADAFQRRRLPPRPPRRARRDGVSVAVRFEDVTVSFSGRTAVSSASFTIPAGKRTAMVGPNGGGKTTLARVLLGLLTPESGRVTLPRRGGARAAPAADRLPPAAFHAFAPGARHRPRPRRARPLARPRLRDVAAPSRPRRGAPSPGPGSPRSSRRAPSGGSRAGSGRGSSSPGPSRGRPPSSSSTSPTPRSTRKG